MKKIICLLFACILSITLVACEDITPIKIDTTAVQNALTQTTTAAPTIETFVIGDVVKAGDYIFTVNSVREDKGTQFLKPKEGSIYYLVDATVENKTAKSVSVSSLLMFKLFDSDGYNYTVTFGPEVKGQLDGEIAAGRKMRGELVFEIPKESKGLELEIDPSLWGSGKVIVKLDR